MHILTIINTTNTIEVVLVQIIKATKTEVYLPMDQVMPKLVYLAITDTSKK